MKTVDRDVPIKLKHVIAIVVLLSSFISTVVGWAYSETRKDIDLNSVAINKLVTETIPEMSVAIAKRQWIDSVTQEKLDEIIIKIDTHNKVKHNEN